MEQQLKWNEENNTFTLITKRDNSLSVETLTLEEAAEWQAENKY